VKLLQNPRTSPLQRIAFAMWHATVTCFAIGILAGPSYSGTKSALLQWQDASTKGVQDSQLSVPGVSRALAIINTCMYDAWAAYDEKAVGTQLGGALRRPASENTPENKQHAISYAAYRALSDVLPADIESVYKPLMRQLGYDPTDNSTDIETPTGIGNVACAAVLEFRHHDKSNQLGDFVPHENQGIAHGPYSDWTSFHPANRPLPVPVKGPIPAPGSVLDPNHWQPLSYVDSHGNTVMQMFAAHWCFIMPFALTASAWVRSESPTECPYAGQFRALLAPGPASFGDPEYIAQAQELIDLSANLTEHQKAVAEFWTASAVNDDPITRWLEFAQVISERNHFSLDDEIKLYFAVSNALMDAQIAACDVKRTYNSVRPITAITFLYNRKEIHAWGGPGKGSVAMDGSQWIPYQPATLPTPPSPDFVSEESAASAAAARVLTLFTGSDHFDYSITIPKESSRIEPGITPKEPVVLHWNTFSEAADEAGMAGRYAGIHFRRSDLAGRALGRAVGRVVSARAKDYFDGIAKPIHSPQTLAKGGSGALEGKH